MSFGPRKLFFSQVSLHKPTRTLLVKDLVDCSCYFYCPPECRISSKDEHLSPPSAPPSPRQDSNMPMLLILMLCILGAAFFFLCYLTMLKRYRLNLRNSRRISSFANGNREDFLNENHRPVLDHPIWYIQTVGLQQSVIDSIAVFKYKKGEGLIEGADCSVCLSEFQEDDSLRLLPKCSHAFHIPCIDTWLRSHKNCPLCRSPIVCDVNISTTVDATLVNTGQSNLDNSGSSGDATVDYQQENDENGEVGASVLRIGGGNIGPLRTEQGKILERNNGIRVLSDLGDHRVRVGDELQSVRRSFSVDVASASMIYAAVAKIQPVKDEGCSSIQEAKVAAKIGNKNSSIHRSRKSFSFGRSLQSVPILMKRSFSSSSKSSHRSSRSQELAQTL